MYLLDSFIWLGYGLFFMLFVAVSEFVIDVVAVFFFFFLYFGSFVFMGDIKIYIFQLAYCIC